MEWRAINGFPYAVSNLGDVKNVRTGRILKPKKRADGYLNITICRNGKRKTSGIHRLVAQAFIPNPGNKPTVNHINEVKHDNRVENLEWATHREQNMHGTRRERVKKNTDFKARNIDYAVVASKHNYYEINKEQRTPVLQFDLKGNVIQKHKGVSIAARATGLNAGHITECCRGRYGRRTCGGYVWRYESNEIEPVPIAVTRYHFKEVHNGK